MTHESAVEKVVAKETQREAGKKAHRTRIIYKAREKASSSRKEGVAEDIR
jgi:hypothetical protein